MSRVIKFRAWSPISEDEWRMGLPFEPFDPVFLSTGGTFPEGSVFMQFTGLLDKDGKEVYEGDIIEFDLQDGNKEYGIVRWSEDGFWTTQDAKHQEELLSDELKSNAYKYKLIGNIYEHKHLLK